MAPHKDVLRARRADAAVPTAPARHRAHPQPEAGPLRTHRGTRRAGAGRGQHRARPVRAARGPTGRSGPSSTPSSGWRRRARTPSWSRTPRTWSRCGARCTSRRPSSPCWATASTWPASPTGADRGGVRAKVRAELGVGDDDRGGRRRRATGAGEGLRRAVRGVGAGPGRHTQTPCWWSSGRATTTSPTRCRPR